MHRLGFILAVSATALFCSGCSLIKGVSPSADYRQGPAPARNFFVGSLLRWRQCHMRICGWCFCFSPREVHLSNWPLAPHLRRDVEPMGKFKV